MNSCLHKLKESILKARREALNSSLSWEGSHALCFFRSIYNAAVWYYHHCQDRMPIVMVTEDEEAIQQYGSETEGVFVISFKVLTSVVSVNVSVCVHLLCGTHKALCPGGNTEKGQ